jgi:hypothetical protein
VASIRAGRKRFAVDATAADADRGKTLYMTLDMTLAAPSPLSGV